MAQVSEAFSIIAELGYELGIRDISKREGCWEHAIDEQWWIALNGHPVDTKCSRGATVPRFTIYVEFNGFPAGIINPAGGVSINDDSTMVDVVECDVTSHADSAQRLRPGKERSMVFSQAEARWLVAAVAAALNSRPAAWDEPDTDQAREASERTQRAVHEHLAHQRQEATDDDDR
jgi:hypothetical protein